jgi:TorA maturation chaperone TorD
MTDDDPGRDAARADLCRFLAGCYYEPGPEFAEEKLFDSLLAAATAIDPELAAGAGRLGEAFSAESTGDLLIEYTRLFLGPVDAPARPYGCVWMGTEKTLMQDSTMAVLKLYEEGGFDLADDFRELPDHIAAELEFLYLLLFRESRAQRDADAKALAETAALKKRFLDEHLGRWVGPFADAVMSAAQSAFYRELADMTDRFVGMEARRVSGA